MNIKSTNAENVLEILSDGVNLFLFRKHKDHIQVQCLNDNLDELSSFNVEFKYHPQLKSTVDDASLYVPTADGLILVIDKFSGDLHYQIDMNKSLVISSPIVADGIYFLTLTPLSTGHYIKTNAISVVSYNRDNGDRRFKTQLMKGRNGVLSVKNGSAHAVVDGVYYQYGPDGELATEKTLAQPDVYAPIITDDAIYLASQTGTLEELNKDGVKRLFVAKNTVPPVIFDNALYWYTNDGIYCVRNSRIQKVLPGKNKNFIYCSVFANKVRGVTETTEIVALNALGQVSIDIVAQTNQIPFVCFLGKKIAIQCDSTLYVSEIRYV